MNRLRFLKLEFCIEATQDYRSRGFVGNKVRGAIGQAMVHLFCPERDPVCVDCTFEGGCIYSDVFKPVRKHPEFTSLPVPFVIGVAELDREVISKGERSVFSVTLFGEAVRYKQHLVEVVKTVFRDVKWGFSKHFTLVEIFSQAEKKVLWAMEDCFEEDMIRESVWTDDFENRLEKKKRGLELIIRFKTPLLTKNNMHLTWGFSEFIDALFYRIAGMIDVYEDREFVIPYAVLHRKPYVIATSFLEGDRFELLFKGDMEQYLPYIQLGEYLHLGKKTTYGFGEYFCIFPE